MPKHAGSHPSVSEAVAAEVRRLRREHPRWSFQLVRDNLVVLARENPALCPPPSYASLCRFMYQDAVVRGLSDRKAPPKRSYTEGRNRALETLIRAGFASTVPTRLALDTIVCRENISEIEELHRWARNRNIFVLLVNYLPSGRTHDGHFGALDRDEQFKLFRRLADIDRDEFGIVHDSVYPYAGGMPCTIRGFGMFVKIEGQVFDCPGEARELGDLARDDLRTIWERARSITDSFDGRCLPREEFWSRQQSGRLHLPTIG